LVATSSKPLPALVRRNNLLKDGGVLLRQVETRFARFLRRARCDNGDGRIGAVGVLAGPYARPRE
jgi:hypothetical protein